MVCMSGWSPLISTDLIRSSKIEFALELKIHLANTGASLSAASVHEHRRVSDLHEENKFLMCAKLQKKRLLQEALWKKRNIAL